VCEIQRIKLHGETVKFLIVSRSVLHRMRNVSDKSCRENQNTHLVFNKCFSKDRDVYKMEKFCRIGNAIDDNIL